VKTMVMEIGVAKVKWSYVAEHVSHNRTFYIQTHNASLLLYSSAAGADRQAVQRALV
jgi:hypothetical protein